MKKPSERRAFERIPYQQPIQIRAKGRRAFQVLAINISMGGLLLGAAPRLSVGSRLELAIPMPGREGEEKLVAEGTVIRVDEAGAAIQFVRTLEPGAVESIARTVSWGSVTSVAVSPATLTLATGATQQFTDTVLGTGHFYKSVTWKAQRGTITSTGLYTAPATGGSDVVTAISTEAPSKVATATVTVVAPAVTSVAVTPATLTLNTGAQSQFTAAVKGTGSFSPAVTWKAQRGTITSAGLYTAPATGGSDVVTATSVQTPTISATSSVTVTAPAAVTSVAVAPGTVSLNTGAQSQFSATVTGTGSYNAAVTWAAQRGTITSAGLYTAPATGGSDVVTATSVQTPTVAATSAVTVVAPVVTAVAVSPTILSLGGGATSQLAAAVTGSGGYSRTVAWSCQRGTITSAGLYTAPASGTDVVTATSVQTPSVSGTAAVTVTTALAALSAPAPISGPVELQVNGGPYTASVNVAAGYSLQWSLTGGTIVSGANTASVQFTAGAGPYATLTCTVSNGTTPVASTLQMVALPFAPRDYHADLAACLQTYGPSITTSIASNDCSVYYADTYYLMGLAAAADATGDASLMTALLGYTSQIMALAQPLTNNGVTTQQLPPITSGAPNQAYTFMAAGPMARAAAIIARNPAFTAQFSAQAAQLVAFVDQSIFQYWFNKTTGVYADPASTYPAGCIPWCSAALGGWGSYAYFPQQAMHLGMISAWMYQATGNPLYLDAATRLAEQFKTSDLQVVNGYYLWDLGRYTFEAPDNQEGVIDTSHANRIPMMMQAMYENGIVFTENDMTLLAQGLLGSIWNQSETSPMFSNYIDGSNLAYRAVTTPGANGLVYHGWNVLGRNYLPAHRVMALTYQFAVTDPALNASVSSNASSYALMEMAGTLARNIAPQ